MTTDRTAVIRTWWDALSDDERAEARAGTDTATLPPDLALKFANLGGGIAAAWWPEQQSGPDAFYMPDEVRDFIEAQAAG